MEAPITFRLFPLSGGFFWGSRTYAIPSVSDPEDVLQMPFFAVARLRGVLSSLPLA